MSKDKSTGPLPSQMLDPPASKESGAVPTTDPDAKSTKRLTEDPEDETGGEDVLDRRADMPSPSRGAVSRFPSMAVGPFNPLGSGAAAEATPTAKPIFPGLAGLMQRQQTAPSPAAAPTQIAEPARPGGTRYQSDEQMTRNMLADYADDLLVTVKVSRLDEAGLASEIGKPIGPVPVSIARDAGNYIDVKGTWTIDFRRASDGKPMSKSKRVTTDGPDYYPGWEPRLRGGDNVYDPKLIGTLTGEVMKSLGVQVPVVGQIGQPGTIGVPSGVYTAEVARLERENQEIKTERHELRAKLDAKVDEIGKLRQEVTTLTMRLEFANSRPKDDGQSKTSDAVQIAQAFASLSKKDDQTGLWQMMMQQGRDHDKAMMDIAMRGKGGAFDDKIQQGWTTLFDGATKLAKAGSSETGEIAKAFGPVVAAWMTNQKDLQIEAMRLKAASQGIQLQQREASQQQKPPAQAEPKQQVAGQPQSQNQQETEAVARIKHKAEVFDAMMGMILHRASSGASADDIGIELAMAVRTAKYQDLAEGHEQHERMIKMLLEDPVSSVTELATVTGKPKEYAEAVARRFVLRYTELVNQPPTVLQQSASSPPATSVPPEPPKSVPAPVPSVVPATVPASEMKAESTTTSVVAKGNGDADERRSDGIGQAGDGIKSTDHPDMPGEPGKGIGVN